MTSGVTAVLPNAPHVNADLSLLQASVCHQSVRLFAAPYISSSSYPALFYGVARSANRDVPTCRLERQNRISI